MKRKVAEDESLLNENGLSAQKRVRSQNSRNLDGTESIEEFTPTRTRRGRPSIAQGTPKRISDFIQESEYCSPDPRSRADGDFVVDSEIQTPSKRVRGRPKGSKNKNKKAGETSMPRQSANSQAAFSTPEGPRHSHENGAILDLPDADRSARRKSARTIIERTITDNISEDEEDEDIARHIYDSDEEDDAADAKYEGLEDIQAVDSASTTPIKRGRGRPKGSKNLQRSPTPPGDLPPHELYFAQNRGGNMKTSNNNLSSLALLDHEEYFKLMREYKDPHADDMDFLQELHSRSFNQWQFELSQDFNICVYGWGSKRKLLTAFAEHTYKSQRDHETKKIAVVNGYVQNATIRDILNTIAGAIEEHPPKLGSQVAEMVDALCALLETDKSKHITLIINSIDASPLRRSNTQTLLARLASHSQISLIASADHPSFPLLWDSSLQSTYNFVFHDCTTFQPYAVEIDVVNEVHELLGRSGRRVGGKEGVSFVLKSLNQNSRKLFQLLVAEQLAAMGDNDGYGGANEHNGDVDGLNNESRTDGSRRNEQGVEYRLLYQKAVEDFICGDEVSFRTLLKEFHDHQMVLSRKDVMGTEMLSVPFRKEELETILEDLMA